MAELDEKVKKIMDLSPFDYYGGDTKYIACVGENGGYDQSTIYDGFNDAVSLMIEAVENRRTAADCIVYPLLYAVRHCIELFLKNVLEKVRYLKAIKNHPKQYNELLPLMRKIAALQDELSFDLGSMTDSKKTSINSKLIPLEEKKQSLLETIYKGDDKSTGGHDLNKLIELIEASYDVDERIKNIFQAFVPVLSQYRNIDPEGDMFKYLCDINGNPHFKSKNIQHVSLKIVQMQFELMSGLFEFVIEQISKIVKEYQTGTFTKELSRYQIEKISKQMPEPQLYSEKMPEFAESIKKKYNLSGRGFDRIIEIIKNHPEFSANHGEEIILVPLRESSLILFAEAAFGLTEWEIAFNKLNKEENAALFTFSDISGWRYFEKDDTYYSEIFKYLYEVRLKCGIDLYSIIPDKEYDYVIKGMKKCGQLRFANQLIDLKKTMKKKSNHESDQRYNNKMIRRIIFPDCGLNENTMTNPSNI